MLQKLLEKAKTKFNNKFLYEIKDAKRVIDKLTIICPIHGEFIQEARVHLRSDSGCPKCSKMASITKQRKNQEQFIKESKLVHGEKYSYVKTLYVNDSSKITITCPIHGDFQQQAGSHIRKPACGCKKCAIQKTSQLQTLPIEKFTKRVNLPPHIQVDFTTYITSKQKVLCYCEYHGVFKQLPEILYTGKGICPTCAKQLRGWNRSLYKDSPAMIYVLELQNNLFKVGISKSCNIDTRYSKQDRQHIINIPFQVTLLNGTDAWELEKSILKYFSAYKYQGPKIFMGTGITEILTSNPTNKLKELLNEQLFCV